MPRQRSLRRQGAVVVFVAFCLVAIVGVAAISVDGGRLYVELRQARATADASAMAAACVLFKHYPQQQGTDADGGAAAAAFDLAASNGYSNDGVDSSVVVNIPPSKGAYKDKAGYVEVIVTSNVERGLSRVWGGTRIPVVARAVARGAWASPKAGVIVLDYDDKAALNSQGNGAFTETGAPVIVNSNNPSAVVSMGNGALIAEEFYVTGGTQVGGNANITTSPVAGKIYLGTHPTPDPLAYLPVPDVPPNGTISQVGIGKGNKLYVLTPGRHANLPTFTTGDVVVLRQGNGSATGGIYYIDGGGFKSTGASIIMGDGTGGIMLYNRPRSAAASEKVQITGNSDGHVKLSGLNQGPYAGMVFWQARDAGQDLLVEGNGEFSIRGTFYAAGSLLNINGNGKTSAGDNTGYFEDENGTQVNGSSRVGSQFICKNLSLGGNGNVRIDYKQSEVARTRIITLVE